MPVRTCSRKPFGQNCRNQIMALVPLSKIKIWFVLFILAFFQKHVLNWLFGEKSFCFRKKATLFFLICFARDCFCFFDLIFSITLPPVQTLNSIEKNVSNLRFGVSLLLTETRLFEKTKDCIVVWLVSIFKFNFLDNFLVHFRYRFQKSIVMQTHVFFADFSSRFLQRDR